MRYMIVIMYFYEFSWHNFSLLIYWINSVITFLWTKNMHLDLFVIKNSLYVFDMIMFLENGVFVRKVLKIQLLFRLNI